MRRPWLLLCTRLILASPADAAAWQRLNLPIGVEQALQDAIKGAVHLISRSRLATVLCEK